MLDDRLESPRCEFLAAHHPLARPGHKGPQAALPPSTVQNLTGNARLRAKPGSCQHGSGNENEGEEHGHELPTSTGGITVKLVDEKESRIAAPDRRLSIGR